MNQAIHIGPLALPVALLLTMAAIALGWLVGQRMARKTGLDAEPLLMVMLAVGVITSRLAFIWQWPEAYLAEPLTMLDIRDGGWEPAAGVVAAFMYGLLRVRSHPALRKPVLAAGLTTGLALAASNIAAVLLAPPAVPLPAVSLTSLQGPTVSLPDVAGKPTVINQWGTRCAPCGREMPVLQQAQAAHRDVHIVFVNQGEKAQAVRSFLAQRELTLQHVLLDPQLQVGQTLGHRSLPTTLFFDARGQLVSTRIGELSAATLAQRLAAVRAGPSPAQRVLKP
jgi:thiol-disulfide isomerase/thioredoxin